MLHPQRFEVAPPLRRHMTAVWRLSGDGMAADDWLLPDAAAATIGIHAGHPSLLGDDPAGLAPQPARCVAGSLTRARLLRHEGALDVIAVELPAACACVLGVPAAELVDVIAPLADIAPGLDRELALFADAYAEGRAEVADLPQLLARHLRPRCDAAARRAAARLVAGASASVDQLAGEVGLSRRQLERRFAAAAGRSPRAFRRLARFSRAVRLAGSRQPDSWAAVAAEAGYVDQPHLVRDFRALAGGAPTAIFSRDWYRDVTG